MKWLALHAKTLALTAVALAGLTIASQSGARAIASVLVQMTNTTAAPGVVQDVSHAASQMIDLTGTIEGFENLNLLQSLRQLNPVTGQMEPGAFFVPQGQSLVVTGVDLTDLPTGGVAILCENSVTANDCGTPYRGVWILPASTLPNLPTSQYKFNPGIVIASGHTIQILIEGTGPGGADYVHVQGYLTSN
jgi:hypothetical protein